MKPLGMVAMVALLLAACRHDGRQVPKDTIVLQQEVVATEDGETQHPAVDTDLNHLHSSLTPQCDTAEITNIQFLVRKQRVIYNPSLLLGEWTNGTDHVVYLSSGKGLRWNISDDVTRDEALHFQWTMDSNLLRTIYPLSMGGTVIRSNVVTFLDEESLVYSDNYGSSYMWDKVTE